MSVRMHVTGGGILNPDGTVTPVLLDPPKDNNLAKTEEKK